MAASYLIVDGHSIIFAWPNLRKLHSQRPERARESLISELTRFQDSSTMLTIVVFDGRGSRAVHADKVSAIQIFFSKDGQTADSVIERLVAKYALTHSITVATDDLMERQTVVSFGGHAISSDELRLWIDESTTRLQETIRKLNKGVLRNQQFHN